MTRIATITLLVAAVGSIAACKKQEEERRDTPKPAESNAPNKASDAPAEATAPSQGGADLVKVVEGCWSAMAAWDKEKFRACYAENPDVLSVDAVPKEMERAKDPIVQAGQFRNAFPDFKAEVALVLVGGTKTAAVGIFNGTHGGRTLGMPPTNKPMSMYYAEVAEVDPDGRIVKARDYMDQATLLHQLGLQENDTSPASEKPWKENVRATMKGDEVEKANLAAFRTGFAALAKGDLKAAVAGYADSATYRYVPESAPRTGAKEIAEARDYFATNKDVEVTLRDAWAAGDWVVAETAVKGSLAEDIPGVKGSKGKTWQQNLLELVEFSGGKIVRHLVFANGLKFASDVGLLDGEAMGADDSSR
jgi:ketosteroid isomerase-like protein